MQLRTNFLTSLAMFKESNKDQDQRAWAYSNTKQAATNYLEESEGKVEEEQYLSAARRFLIEFPDLPEYKPQEWEATGAKLFIETEGKEERPTPVASLKEMSKPEFRELVKKAIGPEIDEEKLAFAIHKTCKLMRRENNNSLAYSEKYIPAALGFYKK